MAASRFPDRRSSDDDAGLLIGRRIRWWRLDRRLTQQVVADRAGIDRTYLSKIESGAARVDRRSTLEKVARALDVSYSDLTGQPYQPDSPSLQAAHSAIARIREAHAGSSLEYGAEVRPRPLDQLAHDVDLAADAWQRCDYAASGQGLGSVLAELHEATAHGRERARALRLLVRALDVAAWTARIVGHVDLAYSLTAREHAAARLLDDHAHIGLATYSRSMMVVAMGGQTARPHGRAIAERVIDEIGPAATGDLLQVVGSLHFAAAHAALPDGAGIYLDEAARIASWTGEGAAFRLFFGPTNLALWRMKVALERGEGGRVEQIARVVQIDAIPSPARRTMFWRDLGVGLSQQRGRQREAIQALLRADAAARGKLRLDPLVREVVGHMFTRAGSHAATELRRLARRAGVA